MMASYVFNIVYTFTRHLALTGWMYRCWPSEAGGDWGGGGGGESFCKLLTVQ